MNKQLKIAATILSLLVISVGTLWAKYEPQENVLKFYEEKAQTETTEELVVTYHTRMNELFNEKTELLINSYNENAIDIAPEQGEKCEAENVSTYCVAEIAVDEYFAFQEVLIKKRSELEIPKKVEGGENTGKLLITELGALQSKRLTFIDEELDVAFETMDVALKAYNELHRAYPLHIKYQEIIAELEQYRDMLVEVRHQIEFFPTKFIDVSTTQCN